MFSNLLLAASRSPILTFLISELIFFILFVTATGIFGGLRLLISVVVTFSIAKEPGLATGGSPEPGRFLGLTVFLEAPDFGLGLGLVTFFFLLTSSFNYNK